MKKLELNQMENLEGGLTKECTTALINLGFIAAGGVALAVGTAGVGSVTFWGIASMWTIVTSQGACSGQL